MRFGIKNENFEIKKYPVKENYETVPLEFNEEEVEYLENIEQELKKEGLTLNDFFISILNFGLIKPEIIKELKDEYKEKQK